MQNYGECRDKLTLLNNNFYINHNTGISVSPLSQERLVMDETFHVTFKRQNATYTAALQPVDTARDVSLTCTRTAPAVVHHFAVAQLWRGAAGNANIANGTPLATALVEHLKTHLGNGQIPCPLCARGE
jgi:hypothetical protein